MKMKPLLVMACCAIMPALTASGANLMLDFGSIPIPAADPNLTLAPGHASGAIPGMETTWNTITSGATNSVLSYSDGASATGVTLSMGAESAAGGGTVAFNGTIGNTTFVGSGGGVAGFRSLITTSSIYGTTNTTANTAPGRDGFIGGGTSAAGSAIGLRVDGLAAGTYSVFVMARNTSASGAASPMTVYARGGLATETTFTFGGEPSATQANTVYTTAEYTNQYTTFSEGNNYSRIDVTITAGQSLLLAIDGSSAGETRGFLNMIQIVAVPEPATALLGSLGLLGCLRRRR